MWYHDDVRSSVKLHRTRGTSPLGVAAALALTIGCGPAGTTGPNLAGPSLAQGHGSANTDPSELPPIGQDDPEAERCFAAVRGRTSTGSTTLTDCRAGGLGACETRCRQGELRSCRDLGRAMANERGDDACAVKLWELTCERGEPQACMDLAAHLTARGTGAGDHDRAKSALQRSCEVGWGAGCTALGRLMLRTGSGPSDVARALQVLERACDRGHGTGCALAGHQLAKSSRRPDQVRALAHYRQACKLGQDRSCVSVATALQRGTSVAADPARALEILEQVCDRDDANDRGLACGRLAAAELARVKATTPRTDELTERACTKGHLDACPATAAAYYQAGRFADALALATPLTAKRPNDAALRFALGMSLYTLDRFADAEPHLVELCRLRPRGIHPQLWLYLARTRAGHDGKPGLRQVVPDLDPKQWPAPVVRYFLGRLSEARLLAKAKHPNQQIELEHVSEAYFYIAQQHLIARRKRQAVARLEQVLDTRITASVEYASAKAQLAKLSPFPR